MGRQLNFLATVIFLTSFPAFQVCAQIEVQDDDPIFGTWVLDKSQSMFFGRQVEPLSQTRSYVPHPDGVKSTIETVRKDGTRTVAQFVSAHDGVPSPFYGADIADEITLQRRGPYEAYVKLSNGAADIGTAWRNISQDGKVMTVRFELGGNVASIRVYNKLED